MVVVNRMCPTEVVVEPGGWSNVFWLVVDLDGQSYVNVKSNDVIVNGVERKQGRNAGSTNAIKVNSSFVKMPATKCLRLLPTDFRLAKVS